MRRLPALLAFAMFLPTSFAFAAEETSAETPVAVKETVAPVETAAADDVENTATETAVKSEDTNESILNYLESEDYIFAAERIPTNRWDTPANIHVITAEEIEANHYQTVGEALSHVNGVLVTDLGMDDYGTVQLNGAERVLILIDGRRMISNQLSYELQRSKSNLSVIPSIKMIERIEIVKGGMSALYGSDAVGGVVNIITKRGTRNETTFDVNAGSWSTQNLMLTNQGVNGKFSWFVTGDLHRRSYYKEINNSVEKGSWRNPTYRRDTVKSDSGYHRTTASVRLDNRFDERSSLTLSGIYKDLNYSGDWSVYQNTGIYRNIALSYNFKEGTSTPGWLRYFNDYTSSKGLDNSWGTSTHHNVKMQGVEYQNGWELGRHKIIAGFEWHRHSISTNTIATPYDGTATNLAAYAQDTIRLGNKWTVIPGVRYDHDKGNGGSWSPKISVNYRADDKTKFYGSWGRVYNPPSYPQLYAEPDPEYVSHLNYYLRGNPNVRAERGHTETLGMEHNFDDDTSIAINYFRSNMKDGITWDAYHFGDYDDENRYAVRTTYNTRQEKRRGIEIQLNKKISDKWRVNLGYAYIKGDDYYRWMDLDLGRRLFVHHNYVYYQPEGWRVGVHYNCGAWKANLLANIGTNEGGTPAKVVVLDANVSYDVKDYLTVYARIRNLTNQDYGYLKGTDGSYARFFQVGAVCRF